MADQKFLQELLTRKSGNAEPPKPLPNGEYLLEIGANPTLSTNDSTGNAFYEVRFKVLQPSDDIDKETLPDGWDRRVIRDTIWITEDALHRFDKFLACIDLVGTSYIEAVNHFQGKQLIGDVVSKPSKSDSNVFYATINGYRSAE